MGKIIWLASYPKSGNTWVRALLANYLFSEGEPININELARWAVGEMAVEHYDPFLPGPAIDQPPEAICAVRPKAHMNLSETSDGAILVKTHNKYGQVFGTPTITPEATRAAVYIVRSPLDTIVSFADFFGMDLDTAIERTASPDLFLPADEHQVHQFLGSWSSNVSSWLQAKGIPLIFIRYEALLADTKKILRDVLGFLQIDIDEAKLDQAVEFSSFGSLAAQEADRGFVEASPKTKSGFFRSGKSGGWRDVLSQEQIDRIVRRHQAMMRKLGYIDSEGRPTV